MKILIAFENLMILYIKIGSFRLQFKKSSDFVALFVSKFSNVYVKSLMNLVQKEDAWEVQKHDGLIEQVISKQWTRQTCCRESWKALSVEQRKMVKNDDGEGNV